MVGLGMLRKAPELFCVFLLLTVVSGNAPAQATFGTITGTVSDSSGAVVAAAAVTVTNEGTHLARNVVTDGQGNYSATDLPPGNYVVRVQASGFQATEHRDVTLEGQQVLRLDARLQVGGTTTQVTVSSGTPAIESETTTISSTVDAEQLHDTATNLRSTADATGDSGIFGFISLIPTGYQSSGARYSLGGARGSEDNFNVDGISSNSPAYGNFIGTLEPSFEAIAEVRYEIVNNRAEFGQVANVTTITKSGTNNFHGGVFYFNQNNAFDARNFFASTEGRNIFNDFGGTLGGPIKRDKLFFFFTYEGDRQRTPAVVNASVPTAAMQTGDFSQLLSGPNPTVISNPYTGMAYPNNVIPTSDLNPSALAWQKLFTPQPNYGSADSYVSNFRGTYPQSISHNEYDGRVDYNITPGNLLYARYFYKVAVPQVLDSQLPPSIAGYREQRRTAQQSVLSDTWTISPTLINEAKVGFSRDHNSFGGSLTGESIVNDVGIQGIPAAAADVRNIPMVSISGFTTPTPLSLNSPSQNTFQYVDQLTWVKGNHSVKTGIEFRPMQYNLPSHPTFGTYDFDGIFSGFAYADFLLGLPDSTSRTYVGPSEYARLWFLSGFVQDDWNVSHKLTVSAGVRYEYDSPAHDKNDFIANFNPANGDLVVPNSSVLNAVSPLMSSLAPIETAQQAGFPSPALRNGYFTAFQPRIGLAYRPFENTKTVLRAAYGIFNDELTADTLGFLYGAPFGLGEGFVNQISNGSPLLTFSDPFVGAPGVGIYDVGALAKNLRNPYTQQWNFTVEQDLGARIGLRLSYVGLKATDLLYGRDLNQIPASTNAFDASLRPYPNYQSVIQYANGGNQDYNAFTAEVTRRWSGGLMFEAAYTWAKSLTDVDEVSTTTQAGADVEGGVIIEDSFDRSRDKGNSEFSPRNRFVSSFSYELPFGPGKALLNRKGLLSAAFGGWQLSGNVVLQSGLYYTPSFSGADPSNTNTFGGRPDVVGNYQVSNQSINSWFNPSAFAVPTAGHFGNAGNGIIEGPGEQVVNAGLFKSFDVTERLHLRVQASFTNVFNHPNFAAPNLNISTAGAGQITSVQTANFAGPRAGQIGARLEF